MLKKVTLGHSKFHCAKKMYKHLKKEIFKVPLVEMNDVGGVLLI